MPEFYCSAILFDLDGVLVDSTASVARQWQKWAELKEIDPEKVMKIAHGVRAIEIIKEVAPHLDAEEEVRRIEGLEVNDQDGVFVMPGAAELLASVPDDRRAVVTSGRRHLATGRLQWANLPVPRIMVPADDVSKGKPDPEPYLKAAQLLGIKPSECLVIEDAPAGIRAARAAGMKVIGITSTYPASALHEADALVNALAQIRVSSDNGEGKLRVSVNAQP
jgi:mannitol-1-/sugar-/sorbitol-6-phosphatase